MKICFFLGSITGNGGTERVCIAIANELSRIGHEVYLVSLWGAEPFFEVESKIQLRTLYAVKKKFKCIYPQVIRRWRKVLKEVNADTVIDVESMLCLYTLPARLGLSFQHIVWEHFNFAVDLGLRSRNISRKVAAKYAHQIVVLTQRDATMWKENIRCHAKIVVIPNPRTFKVEPADLARLDERKVLAAGRLTYQKGFDLLLHAWSKAAISEPAWKLMIIGDGEDRKALVGKCERLQLGKVVEFIPATKNIRQFYKQASIFCLSSRFEGFPMVLLEAQSFGLPVVAFNCDTGPSEIIVNGENGLLIEPGNTEELASALVDIMSNKELRVSMQKKALSRISEFDLKTIVERWLSVLNAK